MNAKKNPLELLLEGKIDHLSAKQLVEIRQILERAARDVRSAGLRLTTIARSRNATNWQLNHHLRRLHEASESVGLLGGLRTVRKRISQIDQELLRRLLAVHRQA